MRLKQFFLVVTLLCAIFVTQAGRAASPQREVVPDIDKRLQHFAKTTIDYDHSLLNENEKQVMAKLIEASKFLEEVFWRQSSEENPTVRQELVKSAAASPQMAKGLEYFDLMKGRWDELVNNEPFISPFGDAGKKPSGAGFYPVDMTKEEFEKWIKDHPEDAATFQGLNTVIVRTDFRTKSLSKEKKLVAVPYSDYYHETLAKAAAKMKEAAALSQNASLKDFLSKRADAFLSNNYYDSDIAWMNVDSPIEAVIGPYEVYEDEMFNYKASFESFLCVVDKPETDRLKMYLQHVKDIEMNLPIPDEHKNPNRGGDNHLRVVQEIFTAGDARHGVQTAAFNLPNDENIRNAKGFKNVLLKNVMQAKYLKTGEPIAKRVLDPSQVSMLSFDAYFNHTLFHEISHGVGPGFIKGPDGKQVETRLLLKELYSTIEECKADVLGVYNLTYAMDQKWFTTFDAKTLFVTNAGLLFRIIRHGVDEAHARGTAVQWNWFRENGSIVPTADGHFKVDFEKTPAAVKSLANELLMIEATGDYNRAKQLLDKYGKATPEIDQVNATLKDLPVDINPVYPAAGEK